MPTSLLADDPHDAQLRANVHPPDWANPQPAARYHLVVIGAGTAGLVTAAGAAGLGAKVALVERDLMGGDCLNVGCVPSKALLRCARAAAAVRDAGEFGVRVPPGAEFDFAAAMERMRRLRAGISPHDSAARFRELGVDVFLGSARFADGEHVEVAGQRLRFKKAVIATGARAAVPEIPGLADSGYLTNESVFALTALPRRMAVLGGGPIGCELAQAFARFGSRVTLIGRDAQLLPKEDADAGACVVRALQRDGVDLRLGAEVTAVEVRGGDKILHIKSADTTSELAVDAILVAAGRTPNIADLNLAAAGVVSDPRKGIVVNDRLQTTNLRIYGAGDVCSRFQFTHAADAMARIVIQNSLFMGRSKASALVIPWCTYTDPEVAHVGLTVRDAVAKNIPHRVFRQELARVDRAMLDREDAGFAEVVVAAKNDKILGATVVAAHAGDLIAEISLAMTAGLGLGSIARAIHPYPTQAEVWKKLGDAYNRTRLTPLVKRLLATWLAWTG